MFSLEFCSTQESEKENWDASYQVLKNKLEMAENQCLRSEIESEKLRSNHLLICGMLLYRRDRVQFRRSMTKLINLQANWKQNCQCSPKC